MPIFCDAPAFVATWWPTCQLANRSAARPNLSCKMRLGKIRAWCCDASGAVVATRWQARPAGEPLGCKTQSVLQGAVWTRSGPERVSCWAAHSTWWLPGGGCPTRWVFTLV